ncbi:hypothetical protein EYC80_008155 [Monilinia laxa]|uniref:Uncharacterized protein n=1 Tax=Monilinia laxa TaxID=61186 RepID=A0A5N6JTM5_MONLA|nr:hypothetical protein EYC80_008155 [Monilinia laxa]
MFVYCPFRSISNLLKTHHKCHVTLSDGHGTATISLLCCYRDDPTFLGNFPNPNISKNSKGYPIFHLPTDILKAHWANMNNYKTNLIQADP